MHRFFAAKSDIENGIALISKDEAAHMKVFRLSVGDEIELIDGEGGRFSAEIIEITGTQREVKGARARLVAALPSNEASVEITLYHGLPKAAKAETVVQKCTELGFYAYAPVHMKNCDVKISEGAKKLDRLPKIALEAAKQSGRSCLPVIYPATEICGGEAVKRMKEHDLLIIPWEKARGSFVSAFSPIKELKSIGIIIGPEGGIDESEIDFLIKNAGAVPVTLGRRILRTETAAISAVAAAMCLLDQWE